MREYDESWTPELSREQLDRAMQIRRGQLQADVCRADVNNPEAKGPSKRYFPLREMD